MIDRRINYAAMNLRLIMVMFDIVDIVEASYIAVDNCNQY